MPDIYGVKINNTQYDFSDEKSLSNLAKVEETSIASKAYSVDDYLIFDGYLCKVTNSIAQGDTIVLNTNVVITTVTEELGGGGHVIKNSSGTDMAQRSALQFNGATISDDSANNKTIVTIEALGTKLTSTVSGNTLTFTDVSGVVDGPYIEDVLVGIDSLSVNGSTITYTLSDASANGKTAYIWLRS